MGKGDVVENFAVPAGVYKTTYETIVHMKTNNDIHSWHRRSIVSLKLLKLQ